MEWSDLRVFLAIAREGTLGAAARKLGQTQPTMGRRLRALEATVGHTLFQRTANGFVLTDEGNAVLSHAERIEEEALAIQRRLAGQENQLDGLLRISSSDWFGTYMLPPVLAEFGRRYAAPRCGDGSGVRVVTMDTAFAEMPDALWVQRVLANAEVGFRSNNREVQAQLCARGAGLAVLPRPLGDATPGIVALDIGESPPGRDSFVGYHRDLRRLSRMRALLDLIIDRLAK